MDRRIGGARRWKIKTYAAKISNVVIQWHCSVTTAFWVILNWHIRNSNSNRDKCREASLKGECSSLLTLSRALAYPKVNFRILHRYKAEFVSTVSTHNLISTHQFLSTCFDWKEYFIDYIDNKSLTPSQHIFDLSQAHVFIVWLDFSTSIDTHYIPPANINLYADLNKEFTNPVHMPSFEHFTARKLDIHFSVSFWCGLI